MAEIAETTVQCNTIGMWRVEMLHGAWRRGGGGNTRGNCTPPIGKFVRKFSFCRKIFFQKTKFGAGNSPIFLEMSGQNWNFEHPQSHQSEICNFLQCTCRLFNRRRRSLHRWLRQNACSARDVLCGACRWSSEQRRRRRRTGSVKRSDTSEASRRLSQTVDEHHANVALPTPRRMSTDCTLSRQMVLVEFHTEPTGSMWNARAHSQLISSKGFSKVTVFGSRFYIEPYVKRSHSKNCYNW